VFTISHPWLATYTAELKKRGIHKPFETITRADRLQSENAAALLRELGCYRIWIGSESGSQKILDAMERGVSVEQVRKACRLAHEHGIQVGMFLMWGYEGEELEDIAATVEHVKATTPDIYFTTVSYPIKGTGYFHKVRERVGLNMDWAEATDRDYSISGRRGRDYYKLADQWLRNEVEAARIEGSNPARSAELLGIAHQARAAMYAWEA
jgi:anaerobic magnesium-protoporphyrin IX monomethyl ester cyclase